MDCNNIRLWYARFDAIPARAFGMPTAVWDDGGWFQLYDHDLEAFKPSHRLHRRRVRVEGVRPLQSGLRLANAASRDAGPLHKGPSGPTPVASGATHTQRQGVGPPGVGGAEEPVAVDHDRLGAAHGG